MEDTAGCPGDGKSHGDAEARAASSTGGSHQYPEAVMMEAQVWPQAVMGGPKVQVIAGAGATHGWPTCLPARSPAALLLASTYPHQMACQWAGVPRGCTRQGDTWPATIPEGSRCHVMSHPCARSLAESLWTQRPDPSTTQVCRGRQAHTREPSQGREGAWHQNPGPGTDAPELPGPRTATQGAGIC